MPALVVHMNSDEADGGVYIGRPSKWGNPFMMPRDGTREQVIAKFQHYIINNTELMAAAKRELRGRVLVCWCAPKPCHGDVLARIANEE